MRIVALLLAIAIVLPVQAAGWGHYINPRFGYAVDVPEGFAGQGESANGDGQEFTTPTATLTVFGQYILEDIAKDFETAAKNQEQLDVQDGWGISYAVSTPNRASYSGVKSGRVLYVRMISLCGPAFAEFRLEYSKADVARFNPIVDRLVGSLKPTDGSVACP